MNSDPEVLSGHKCPYCGGKSEYVKDTEVYPRGGFGGMVYLCRPCNAWVGTHKPRPLESLGRLANAELREAKIAAHAVFDPLWRRKMEQSGIGKQKARGLAYKWLADQMDILPTDCHIGYFDVDECRLVVEICIPFNK